jgi:hypothetical protein
MSTIVSSTLFLSGTTMVDWGTQVQRSLLFGSIMGPDIRETTLSLVSGLSDYQLPVAHAVHESEVMNMELLPKELLQQLPPMDTTADEEDPMVWVKFFCPDFSWAWYAIEFDGEDLFFGFVDGEFPELGYFRLSELLQTRGKLGCSIERDLHFTPCHLSVLRTQLGR